MHESLHYNNFNFFFHETEYKHKEVWQISLGLSKRLFHETNVFGVGDFLLTCDSSVLTHHSLFYPFS